MKKMLATAVLCAAALCMGANAMAAIGWAGNVWPNNGYVTAPTGDQPVYAQVWKGGVTDMAGQGPDIAAELHYQTNLMGAPAIVPMAYNTDIGNNDEYFANIAQADLVGASSVSVTVWFHDLSDGEMFQVLADQNGNPPPFVYSVSNVLPNDVDVKFTVCMSGTPTSGDVCVIGSAPEIGAWGTGVNMMNVGGELWEVTVTFLQGSNPSFEYKYRSDGCVNWEFVGNRAVILPTDGTTLVELAADSFNNAPIGCGLGATLSEDKVVCFQLCMDGIQYNGNNCVIGGVPQLGNWAAGVVMNPLGGGLYQACVTFPAGTAVPLNVEYKYQKDDCSSWEGVANRVLVVDDSMAAETTVTHNWDDNLTGVCQAVANDLRSWSSVKSRF